MSNATPETRRESPISPLLVLGLDGATFDVIHPMVAAAQDKQFTEAAKALAA